MIQLADSLALHHSSVCIIGLGYVGLPLITEVANKYKCVGFDIDEQLVSKLSSEYKDHRNILITSREEDLIACSIYIICVPTDVYEDKSPDLSHLKKASVTVARMIRKGDAVIYESTVYPGCTEEVCIPLLEQSGLKLNKDFTVGYAPERIVPGDNTKSIKSTPRVIASSNEQGRAFVFSFYKSFVNAEIHIAPSIKVAEAAKIVENTQRDLNISLMNELSIIFDKLDIDTESVLAAAATKWNFHPYEPGLVGGHCISVDPFYLLFKSRTVGHEPKVIAAGRAINEFLPQFIVQKIETIFTKKNKRLKGSRILVYGLTFKENIDDIRNSKVIDLIRYLQQKEALVEVVEPNVHEDIIRKEDLTVVDQYKPGNNYDIVILAVKHTSFLQLGYLHFFDLLDEHKILFDLKRIIPLHDRKKFEYWAL